MICNDGLLFIHIGKSGGTSCSRYLLHNLLPPVFNCHAGARSDAERLKLPGVSAREGIHRHCTLAEALEYLREFNGWTLANFKKVVAVIRHPYTIEYSFYKHLQKPHIREWRKNSPRLLAAASGTFKDFVINGEHHRAGFPQEAFFRLDGAIPSCVDLVRFERLTTAFPAAVVPFLKPDAAFEFPHLNQARYDGDLLAELTDEVKDLLYKKHAFMFDSGLYERELTDSEGA